MKNLNKYLLVILLLIVSIVLIWPAIHNGYPLVYSDSGTYIAAGFSKQTPVDRPIIYSLFVRHMSLSYSLWLVLISQAFLVVFVIYMLVREFTEKNIALISIGIIVVLSFTTSISNYTSQIMPDIYSALTIIGISILLISKKMKKREYALAIVVVFSAMSHLSNIILLFGIAFLAFFSMLFRLIEKKIFFRILIISLIPVLCTLVVNKVYSGKFQISKASNIFLLGRMAEVGVVKDYLRENCGNNNYGLCEHIDQIPNLAHLFIWDMKSPLYDTVCVNNGWGSCWEEKNDDFGILVKDIIQTPKYRNQILAACTKDFFKQNVDIEIGPLSPQRDGTPVKNWIKFKFNNELTAYENANQYKSKLRFTTMSKIQGYMVVLSLVVIALLLSFYKKMKLNKDHVLIITMLFAGIIGNALVVVSFSTVLNRYQSRIIWIFPLIALMLIYRYVINLKSSSPIPDKNKKQL